MDSCNESRYQRPSFLSDHFSFPRIRALLLALCVAAAPSLLPASTEIVHVAFSSDGRYLASLDNEGTLYVDDADSRKPLLVVRGSVKGNDFAWRPGKNQIAAAMDVGQGWDIYLINLDGTRKRLTDHPALDSSPQWALDGRKLAFLSTRNDKLNLFELDPETLSVQALDTRAGSVWNPMVQPGGESLAYFSIDTGDIQLWLSSPGREPVMLAPVDPALQYQEDLDIAWDSAGDQLLYVERDMLKDQPRVNLHAYDLITRENKLLAAGPSISNLLSYSSSGALFYRSDKGLQMFPQWRGRHSGKLEAERPFRPNGFSLDHPALSSTAKFAAVVEGNGIALAPTLQAEFNYSFFSAEGYLAQAERLYETGKEREAEAVYALLEKAEPEPGRVIRVRIHHAAQLRKKARYAEALNVLNTLDTLLPPSGKVIPTTSTLDLSQPAVQRGMLACFEQRDFDKARQLFLNAGARRSAPSSQEPMPPSGDAIETAMEAPQRGPLAILQTHNLPLIRLWAEAHAALRNGNVAGCLENMLRLAKQFGSHPAVVDAVLDLFEDPYFSEHLSKPGNPFARPENQTKVVEILLTLEKAGHPTSAILRVIPFTESSPSSEASASRVRLSEEMLQTLVKARQFTPAIDTAQRMLQEGGPGALGVAESLLFYLESERSDPYGRDLITQVMLSPKMVTALESALRQDPVSLSMLQLARIKQALLAGDVKTVQPLLVSTQQIFQGFSNETFTREIARLQTYLYLFAAKRFERQGEWDKALEKYAVARDVLYKYSPENTRYYYLLGAAQDELALGRTMPKLLMDYQNVLRGMGDSVLNPTNQPAQLHAGIKALIELRKTAPSTPLDAFFLYQIGYALSRAGSPHCAVHYLDRALNARPPQQLRAAILLEKSNLLEEQEDWWRQQKTLSDLIDCTTHPVQQDVQRMKSAQALLRLGKKQEAKTLLQTLATHGATLPLRQTAKQQLELIAGR